MGVVFLLVAVGVIGWAYGRTQQERERTGTAPGSERAEYTETHTHQAPPSQEDKNSWSTPEPGAWQNPNPSSASSAPPPPPPNNSNASGTAPQQSSWDKAREEVRRKKEQETASSTKPTPSSTSSTANNKADAEKARWEQARTREREAREKEAREKVAAERVQREQAKAASAEPQANTSRPFNTPNRPKPATAYTSYTESTFSSATGSTFSSASSHSTTPTEHSHPPPRQTGPYTSTSQDKVLIHSVHLFSGGSSLTPTASLFAQTGSVTDGLVLRMTTEGLFVDDDVRGLPLREWDVKAWGIKTIESGEYRAGKVHVLRATVRDVENKRYVFVIADAEAGKVAVGLQRLRKGSQVRSMAVGGMKEAEVLKILGAAGVL